MKHSLFVIVPFFVLGALQSKAQTPAEDNSPTTLKTFQLVESPKLSPITEEVKPVQIRKDLRKDLKGIEIAFPINVWGGWAAMIAANGGFDGQESSPLYKDYKIKLHFYVEPDPTKLLKDYVSGKTPFLWSTVDMAVLLAQRLPDSARFRIMQQMDWSNGGDGVLVRKDSGIQKANDLSGKTVVLAPFSPSHYFILNLLKIANIDPQKVKFAYTTEAYGAARAFFEKPEYQAAVTFSPDIYKIPDWKNEKNEAVFQRLASTKEAAGVIADTWAVREDFYQENKDLVRNIVMSFFEGLEVYKANPQQVAQWMVDGYARFGTPLSLKECQDMIGDAFLTGFSNNMNFFNQADDPTNFARTWENATAAWKTAGLITKEIPAKDVLVNDFLRSVTLEKELEPQKTAEAPPIVEMPFSELLKLQPIVSQQIAFGTGSDELVEDETVAATLQKFAETAGQFRGTKISVIGYMNPIPLQGTLENLAQRENENPQVKRILTAWQKRMERFSLRRANYVKNALQTRFGLKPDQIEARAGKIEDVVTKELENSSVNRRVELRILRPE